MTKERLPSLGLLNTFEVAARHLSFTRAAEELCLTQGAVSRQIKALEEQVGVALFVRKHRSITLSLEGTELYNVVLHSLDEIGSCLETIRKAVDFPQITVAASVSFAYFWLMPRLEKFSEVFPDIDLRVLASDQKVDLSRDEADVAILVGRGQWEGVQAEFLFGEKVYPVCSPGYLAVHPELRQVSDMLDQTLLHMDSGGNIWGGVDWQTWLAKQGVKGTPKRRGIRMNSYPVILQAAQAGRGIALGWSYIVDEMVAEGHLVCPVDEQPLETGSGYYVGSLNRKASIPSVAAFFQWILEEARFLQKNDVS